MNTHCSSVGKSLKGDKVQRRFVCSEPPYCIHSMESLWHYAAFLLPLHRRQISQRMKKGMAMTTRVGKT